MASLLGRITGPLLGSLVRPLGARSEGVGAWAATLATLRAFLDTTEGADNPRSLAENNALATITTPASKEAAYSKTFALTAASALTDTATWLMNWYGGYPARRSGDSVAFIAASRTSGGNGPAATQHALTHSYRVRTNAPALYYSPRRASGTSIHRVLVNGQYVSKTAFAVGSDVNQKWVKIDLGSSADRIIEVESSAVGDLFGFWVEPAYTLLKPDETRPRVLFMGDSITATTAADNPSDGFGLITTDYLGLQRPVLSGIGGQGFLTTSAGYTFRGRLTADITNRGPWDLIVIAGGFNDKNADPTALEAEIAFFFAQLRAENPAAVIVAVCPWDNKAPLADDGTIPRTALHNVLDPRADVFVLDPVGVEYDHPDGNHPSTAGHATLGVWLDGAIRTALAA